jgi:hypothetical protein
MTLIEPECASYLAVCSRRCRLFVVECAVFGVIIAVGLRFLRLLSLRRRLLSGRLLSLGWAGLRWRRLVRSLRDWSSRRIFLCILRYEVLARNAEEPRPLGRFAFVRPINVLAAVKILIVKHLNVEGSFKVWLRSSLIPIPISETRLKTKSNTRPFSVTESH